MCRQAGIEKASEQVLAHLMIVQMPTYLNWMPLHGFKEGVDGGEECGGCRARSWQESGVA